MRFCFSAVMIACLATTCIAAPSQTASNEDRVLVAPSKITINEDGVLVVDGKKLFPITFTMAPPPDGKAPDGRHAYDELREAGATFMRSGQANWMEKGSGSVDKAIEAEKRWQDAAAAHGMRCHPWLGWDLSSPKNEQAEEALRTVVNAFKSHPGMGLWKGEDEPQWGKKKPAELINAAKIIHEADPSHPIWIVQAPRGSVEDLKPYVDSYDVGGIDIYPISYPPGTHVPTHPNKEISMVGDWTRHIMAANEGRKPVWMTLQIAFSGTVKQTATLRFPTFPQQRYMAFQAIVSGARGLVYFGGNLNPDGRIMNDRDAKLGWNWTFWEKVQRDLVLQVGDKSPLHPALVAANSKLPIKVTMEKTTDFKMEPTNDPFPNAATQVAAGTPAKGMEYVVREVDNDIYIIATKREGPTIQVKFDGIPEGYAASGEVMFETPRTVQVKDGSFTDWFAPFDVHVYHLHK